MATQIFLVEKDRQTRALFQAYLSTAGYRSMSFESAKDALVQAQIMASSGNVPSILLLDYYLPELNGLELLKAIKQFPEWSKVPCLFLSSASDPEIIMQAHALGATDFLPKSIRPEVFLERIRQVLRQSQHLRAMTETPDEVGSTLIAQRYQIIQPLGAGGMAQVFLVQDLATQEYRALKMLSPSSTEHQQVETERFKREIRTQSELNHPNLVTVHDMGVFGHLFYYTMDYLPNGSLLDRMTQVSIAVDESIRIIAEIASVLQFIHDHQILHRDLKPENIIFSNEDNPVLIDFGLVLRLRSEEVRLTGEHQVLGTTPYMAPERMRGNERVDHRSDIFSLGILLYSMLTDGVLPHEDESMSKAYKAIKDGLPSPRKYKSSIPNGVAKVCMRAIQYNPQKRYRSCADMQMALLRELQHD